MRARVYVTLKPSVFDPQGRVRLFLRYGGGAEAMAHDIRLLLAGA